MEGPRGSLSRRDLLKGLAYGGGALALAGGSLRTAYAAAPAANVKRGGVIQWALSQVAPSIHPFRATGAASTEIRSALHRSLLTFDHSGKVVPELAQSFSQPNQTTYVFNLRDGIKFQNGDPITPADVAYSISQIRDPATAADLLNAFSLIESVEQSGTNQVTIKLSAPSAPFLQYFATPNNPVVSHKSQPSANNWIGAGPFLATGTQTNASYSFEKKSPYYFKKGLPYLDGVKFIVINNDQQRSSAVQTGQVDITQYVPYPTWTTLQNSPSVKVDGAQNATMLYLQFNVAQKPFSDVRVRQAVAYAVNRPQVVRSAYFGHGQVLAGLPIAKSSPFYNPKYQNQWPLNIKKAKSLLAEAGYPDGFTTEFLVLETQPDHVAGSLVVQQNLLKIGIKCTIEQVDIATRLARGNAGAYQMHINGSSAEINDPSGLATFISGPTFYGRSANFDDPQIDALLAKGTSTMGTSARKQIYDQLQAEFLKSLPIVPLATRNQGYAFQKYVSGFNILPADLVYDSAYLSIDTMSLSKQK